ncbi:uncharacterized protein LOC141620217 [Silene latifolia]|uniref:uncharacterized protein LOC141620217 n=1 Tax=Silene latifolia TaxID=37657 RepID=UPI003D779079
MEKVVSKNRKDWSRKLDDTLWAYRTEFITPIGASSYHLIYGKACHLPVELEYEAMWAIKEVNMDFSLAGEKRLMQLNELDEFRLHAYGKLRNRWSGLLTVVEVNKCETFKLNGQRLKVYYDGAYVGVIEAIDLFTINSSY